MLVPVTRAVLVASLVTVVSAWTAPAAGHEIDTVIQASAQKSAAKQVEVNSASLEELQTVPGIGAALAQRIIDFREEFGPFERLDDLLNVRGIGERYLERLRPHLTVKKPKKQKKGKSGDQR
ncbi:MAG: ComEA family DNA-binding protein [Acidobacteriota bacterium]